MSTHQTSDQTLEDQTLEDPTPKIFTHPKPFKLQSGVTLRSYHLAYHTYGKLNEAKDNAVWVFHALTASSDPCAWWPGLVGTGKYFDPQTYFIICVNMPGSCYGSIGPLEIKPGQPDPYYHDFPLFTIDDMVRAYQPLRDALGIRQIHIGIGGSMGGQQLLQWAVREPEAFRYIIPIATNALHSAWAKAFNASQRWSIEADPTWLNDKPEAGLEGMKVARSVALLSYRNYHTYEVFQSEDEHSGLEDYKAAAYQRHQGEKLAARFNAFSYYQLSKTMDSHHVGRSLKLDASAALGRIRAKTLVISIKSDILFPVSEQMYLADNIPDANLSVIDSTYGHDGFLLESAAITESIRKQISEPGPGSTKPLQDRHQRIDIPAGIVQSQGRTDG